MAAVSSLASDIHDTVVDLETAEDSSSQEEKEGDALTEFATPHPERAYKKGIYGGDAIIAGDQGAGFESRGVRKSGVLPMTVESIAVGDLNGNGVNDLVVASKSKLKIFEHTDLQFKMIASYDFSPRMKIHQINIGDPGSSGTSKLFVSGNNGRFASSSILSWDGSQNLQMIRQDLRWYIRPITIPGKGELLIGQRASHRIEENFLSPGVFQLSFDPLSRELAQGAKLLLPKGTNLFDFIQADLDGDGGNETVIVDTKQKLLVYDSALNLIWVSSANYGGSKTYFGPNWEGTDSAKWDDTSLSDAQQSNRTLVFIPSRLDVKDITGDGLPEVVVSTNEVTVSKYFSNTRTYDGGSVACLGWHGQGLNEIWQTNRIGGYVADYFFDDAGEPIDSDADIVLNRLYVAQIPAVPFWKQLLPAGESKLLAYEMKVKKFEQKTDSP